MKTLLFILGAGLVLAQTPASGPVFCKTSLLNSINMKGLYGGRTPMFQAQVECQNYGLADAKVSAVTIDLSMSTVNSLPAAQASALLTKTFNGQPGQQIAHDSIAAIGILGALQAGKYAFVAAGPFGWVVAGVALATQYIIPLFTANQIPLDFSNQCGNLQNGMMLAAGASMTCTTYIQKPPKGYPLLPGAFTFNLLTDSPPTPGPLPNSAPVQLRRPEHGALHINPDAVLGTEQFRAALRLANASLDKNPDNPAMLRTEAILLRELGENETADVADGIAQMKQARMERADASLRTGLSARAQ